MSTNFRRYEILSLLQLGSIAPMRTSLSQILGKAGSDSWIRRCERRSTRKHRLPRTLRTLSEEKVRQLKDSVALLLARRTFALELQTYLESLRQEKASS